MTLYLILLKVDCDRIAIDWACKKGVLGKIMFNNRKITWNWKQKGLEIIIKLVFGCSSNKFVCIISITTIPADHFLKMIFRTFNCIYTKQNWCQIWCWRNYKFHLMKLKVSVLRLKANSQSTSINYALPFQ